MLITATEFKNNFSKYLSLAATEEVFITKNGKVVAKLTSPFQDKIDALNSIVGVLPQDASVCEARSERIYHD